MASSITSAGSASGMDFESIISASVQAKQAQINRNVTVKKEETNIEISGVGKFKDALSTFQKSLQAFTENNAFNQRKVTINQPSDNPYFSVTAKEDASNLNLDIAVKQLASSEKISKTFNTKEGFENKFSAGKLTIDLGYNDEDGNPAKIEIDVQEGDSLELIRKRINNNDYGVTVNLIQTSNGYSFEVDTGKTGVDKSNISITGSTDELQNAFGYSESAANSWSHTEGKNAIISVNGQDVESDTNNFDEQISGIELTVNRLTETKETTDENGDTVTEYETINMTLAEDYDAMTKKMEEFVNAYNTLQSTLDALYEHNTYTDGENQYDGGELAGDSSVRALKTQLNNIITSFGADGSSNKQIFDMGLEFTKDGTLKLDSTEFKDNIKTNFNTVVNAFSGEDGLLKILDDTIEEYTKSGGILDTRNESLQEELKSIEDKEKTNQEYIEKYEESLRQKYANLDTTIAGYNNSLNYLYSIV